MEVLGGRGRGRGHGAGFEPTASLSDDDALALTVRGNLPNNAFGVNEEMNCQKTMEGSSAREGRMAESRKRLRALIGPSTALSTSRALKLEETQE